MKTGVITLTMAFALALAFLFVAGFPPSSEAGSCPDEDSDTICDPDDNCRAKPNTAQVDANSDGYGNQCDTDWDNNGNTGVTDFGLYKVHFGHMTGDDAADADIDYNVDGGIGVQDFGGYKLGFGTPPGPSGKSCADPTSPGTCP